MTLDVQVQVRSESHGLQFFSNLKGAVGHVNSCDSCWKLSYTSNSLVRERFVLTDDGWKRTSLIGHTGLYIPFNPRVFKLEAGLLPPLEEEPNGR